MRNFIRKFFKISSDISQESHKYSRLTNHLKDQFSVLRAASLLTDKEYSSLNSSLPEIDAVTLKTFPWASQLQQYLKEHWDPELKIQREKEEAARRNPEVDSGIRFSRTRPVWYIGITSDFTKSISKIDKKIQGRILEAITHITADPMTPNGNTIKPLSGEKSGMWRYRIGDYRIIYHPDETSKQILLLTFSPRGSAYKKSI